MRQNEINRSRSRLNLHNSVLWKIANRYPSCSFWRWCWGFSVLWTFQSGLALAGGAGTTAADFLRIPVGARATGMGGAQIAATEDSAALVWNPAGLSFGYGYSFTADHVFYAVDTSVDFLTAAYRFPRWGTVAVAMRSFDGGDIDGTLQGPGGTFGGPSGRTLKLGDLAVEMGWAYPFWRTTGVGLALRGIVPRSTDLRGSEKLGLDLGVEQRLGSHLRLGVVLRNLGRRLHASRQPLAVGIGGSYLFENSRGDLLLLALDAEGYRGTGLEFRGGMEGRHHLGRLKVAGRAGYQGPRHEGRWGGLNLGAGMGFEISQIPVWLDYAYSALGELGQAHRMGLRVEFESRDPRAKAGTRTVALRPSWKGKGR